MHFMTLVFNVEVYVNNNYYTKTLFCMLTADARTIPSPMYVTSSVPPSVTSRWFIANRRLYHAIYKIIIMHNNEFDKFSREFIYIL